MEYGFGLASIREEGCPIDPIDAIEFTGPGATSEWFKRQQHAFFEHRRSCGDTEEELMRHPFYLPPNVELRDSPASGESELNDGLDNT